MKRAALALLFAIATTGPLAAETGFAPIAIRAIPVTEFLRGSSETEFGALRFLGGLELVSRDSRFGSLSGLDFAPDGTLYAVADTGFWFRARLTEEAGRPTGLADTELGPVLGDDGKPPAAKIDTDAEGLRLTMKDGRLTALVSFEQTARVRAFAGPDFAAATPAKVPLPKFVSGLRRNQGLESIAVAPAASPLAGAIVVIAERSLDAAGNHRGFILSGPQAGAFTIRRSDDLDVSDATFLPDGDLVILERRFSFSGGFAMRLRRIAADQIKPGALLDGTVLMTADAGYQIDNLEGLAARTATTGETILTLVSDDNNNLLQRTLLLQFALPADADAPLLPQP
jgi:hypothetical protein